MAERIWHKPELPTTDEYGAETHPAFGAITAHRISDTPGAILFDSDVQHAHFVRVSIGTMTRQREIHRDRLLSSLRPLVEVEMSEAQWASFVSSMNTSAVPCTIRVTENETNMPGLKHAPRLDRSMTETHEAADRVFGEIKQARDAYEAVLSDKASTAKQKREALRTLHYKIENATSGVDFAAKSLVEHAENVVQKARADVEAMVSQKAQQLGIERGELGTPMELGQ